MTAFRLVEHKKRGCCIFFDDSSGLSADLTDRFVGIIDHQLLSESIDIMLGSSRNNEFMREKRGKTYRISNLVTP